MTTPNIAQNAFALAPFPADGPLHANWNAVDLITLHGDVRGRYIAGFANSDRCVEAALRLRYEVFNIELGEGLPESVATGLDRDEFDAHMSHLVLLEAASHNVVGTYRMQTAAHALKHGGLYSSRQYDVTALEPYLPRAVELGRACLAREHRMLSAIMQLWLGIGAFMNRYDQVYLFGCSSITTNDPGDGWRAMKTIRENGYLHPDLCLPARAPFSCGHPNREFDEDLGEALRLPKLFRTYIRLGARVISEPAIDTEFGSVDFLVMMDGREVTLSSLDVLK